MRQREAVFLFQQHTHVLALPMPASLGHRTHSALAGRLLIYRLAKERLRGGLGEIENEGKMSFFHSLSFFFP